MSDNPTWSTGYPGGGTISFFTFYNNNLYFPTGNEIIQTDSSGTIITGNWAPLVTLSSCFGCVENNGNLYVTTNGNTIIEISIADPSIFNSNWATVTNISNGAIVSDGTYLYVAGSTFISRILINDPTQVDNNFLTGFADGLNFGLAVGGGYLYIANNIYDVARASTSIGQSSLILNWATLPSVISLGLVLQDNYVYVSNNNGIIYQILTSNSPTVSVWKTSPDPQSSYYWRGIAYNPYYIYVHNGNAGIISQFYLEPPPPPPPLPCFKKDSKILTDQGYKLVQDLRKGDLVKTLNHGFLPIDMIGKRDMHHDALEERIKNQLYQYSNDTFEEIFEPLIITGCHSILIDEFVSDEERAKTAKVLGDIYLTDDKYRLPACVDEKASVYEIPGDYTIYHIALENEHYTGNYGIYANGLLVETCSKRYLKEHSHMVLIE